MTDYDINSIIAGRMGWTSVVFKKGDKYTIQKSVNGSSETSITLLEDTVIWKHPDVDGTGRFPINPPNYCEDLNLMREAELSLNIPKQEKYSRLLHKNCFSDYLAGGLEPNPIFAGAYQRALTFVELHNNC